MNSDNHYFLVCFAKISGYISFSFLIAPTGYIVKIVISNSVSVEELWVLYSVMSLMTILGSYNDFGMTESLNYFLPGYIHDKRRKKNYKYFFDCTLYANGYEHCYRYWSLFLSWFPRFTLFWIPSGGNDLSRFSYFNSLLIIYFVPLVRFLVLFRIHASRNQWIFCGCFSYVYSLWIMVLWYAYDRILRLGMVIGYCFRLPCFSSFYSTQIS
jgi:hypothetical protein